MKKIIFILIFIILFSFGAVAEDFYSEQYQNSGAEDLYDLMPETAKGVIDNLEIEIQNPDWVNKITAYGIFSEILGFVKTGAATPLKCGGALLSVILLITAANTFEGFKPFSDVASYIFTLSAGTGVLIPMFSLIESSAEAVKGISVLMDGFVPIYAGILSLGGQVATATGMSFLLLGAAGIVGSLSAFVIVPLMSCYLGVAAAGSVMPMGTTNRLGDGIKNIAMWTLSLILTLFLGLLSIQTTINKAADNLTLKTAKFMIGSFIPVAGGALSESLGTLISSVSLLKSTVGMFAVVGIAATILPVVIELLIWRVVLFALSVLSELLGVNFKTDIISAADSVLAVLIGVMLFIGAIFIISLGIIAGGF